jgi:hypothetical protein
VLAILFVNPMLDMLPGCYLVYAARLAMVNLMAGSAGYAGYDGKLHWLAMLIG